MSLKTTPTPDPAAPAPAVPPDATPLETFFKGNRPLTAAALLLLLEAVPVAGLVMALREDGGVWMVFAATLIAGALLPPVGVLLGQRWGYVLGQYVVWGSLVGVILRVLHAGFTLVYLAPAVLLGVLLVSLSAPRSAGESRRTEKKPESFGVWLKENVEAIVIAFIMALVIRCFCIEVFKIPSSSMEPTLLGDLSDNNHPRSTCTFKNYHVPLNNDNAATGDRIMVTKYYYTFSPIERFDVLVFKFPLNQAKNFIKRVVGLPGEYLMIHRGNLYTSKDKDKNFQIARRTLRTQDSLWINPAKGTDGYLARGETFNEDWQAETPPGRTGAAHPDVRDGELSTQEKNGERSAQFSYRHSGYLDDGGSMPVDDARIVFDFELTSPHGKVFAELVNAYGRFEAVLDTDGGSWLFHYKPGKNGQPSDQPTDRVPLKDVQLSADRRYKLELAVFDGMAYVRVNDGERGRHPFITLKDEIVVSENPDRRIAFGSRGATFRVKNLALGRDIYYRGRSDRTQHGLREDDPVEIPLGSYMMMGDNVANSHDSRAWVKRTFKLKDGRTIECESQQVHEGMSSFNTKLQEKLGLPQPPRIGIDGDVHGNEVAIMEDQYLREEEPTPYRFVDEKYIVGKALWIWWPQGRWFHLIR